VKNEKSEFHKILEAKISIPNPEIPLASPSSSSHFFENLHEGVSKAKDPEFLFFDQGFSNPTWRLSPAMAKKIYAASASPAKESSVKSELSPSAAAAPSAPKVVKIKKRVKRKLSFDQLRAIELFKKLGETITDESFAEEIKTSYRRLALKYHPDAGAKTDETFKKISSAYKKLIF
jgi:hypothetical protein